MAQGSVQVLRAVDRFRTERDAVSTTHGFSFGDHYDPERVSFGVLVAHNVETLRPGGGYAPHRHRDLEIVTWVVRGSLEHNDDHGHLERVEAGTVQRLTAAAGVTHSEVNAAKAGGPVAQFVQMWLQLPVDGLARGEGPSYERSAVDPEALRAGWVPLASDASGRAPAIALRTPGVTLWGTRLAAGETRPVPAAALSHVYVVSGSADLDGGERLGAADTLMLRDSAVSISAVEHTEILALSMT